MTVLIDTNVVIRHLTGQPPDQGRAASLFLKKTDGLLLTDVIAVEIVHVLKSVYKTHPGTIVTAMRALLAMRSVTSEHPQVIQRTIDLYEAHHMDFTDAYLVAVAEASGIDQVASFDEGIDKAVRHASKVTRLDPIQAVGLHSPTSTMAPGNPAR